MGFPLYGGEKKRRISIPRSNKSIILAIRTEINGYLLTRFAYAGSIFSVNSVSPSFSSSSDCSLDDPLVAGFTGTPDFFCVAGKEGIPSDSLASLSSDMDKSYPAPAWIMKKGNN